jgi:exoribonuclease R
MYVSVDSRDYDSWRLYDHNRDLIVASNTEPLLDTVRVSPLDSRLFHGDRIEIDPSNQIQLVYSPIRNAPYIAGVLILENNKTFGRTENKKKLLYRCIPDNKNIPIFLIPYEVKLGFSKVQVNKYIIFKFQHWEDKHPRGLITETIGDVDGLAAYYEYRLYCKQLHIQTNQLSKSTHTKFANTTEDSMLENIIQNGNYRIEKRDNSRIISIDPAGSLDIDDAFGIEPIIIAGEQTGWIVSIYIANVFVWLEELKLWEDLSDRVATIYLPDGKRSMLPKMLSENICSLLQNKTRLAFTIDIPMDMNGVIDQDKVRFLNTQIKVFRNYAYDDPALNATEPVYNHLLHVARQMNERVHNSHDLVEHWMICMNVLTGKVMARNRCGIFRKMAFSDVSKMSAGSMDGIPTETARVMRSWNNVVGGYVLYSDTTDITHNLLNMSIENVYSSGLSPHYVHITSPIRRLVDVLNQIILSSKLGMCDHVSEQARLLLDKWLSNIITVNDHMKSIRKIQQECDLLYKCSMDETLYEQHHSGYVVDKKITSDGMYKYTVYLPSLKMFGRIQTTIQCYLYSEYKIAMYMFQESDTIIRKIRLQLL